MRKIPGRLALLALFTSTTTIVVGAPDGQMVSTFECPESVSSTAGLPDYPLMDSTPSLRRYRITAPDGWSAYRTNNYSSVTFRRQGHSAENRYMNCFYGYPAQAGEDGGMIEMWFHSLRKPFPDGMNCLAISGFAFRCSSQTP